MTIDEVLRRREDQHLEFKSARSLAEPETVAREVVGMLNAEGGTIWIGIEDDKDGAAGAVEAIADAEREKGRLLDYLLETVDPSPISDEVTINVQPFGAGERGLLKVRVQPPPTDSPRRPFAFLRKAGRHYVRRIGSRNHPMTRDEIFGRRAQSSESPVVDEAIRQLMAARNQFRDSGADGLWVGLQPARRIQLNLQNPRIDELTSDPTTIGVRRTGYSFSRSNQRARLLKDRVEWKLTFEDWEGTVSSVSIHEDGGMRFHATLQRLLDISSWGEERELQPIALLEYTVSAFRIARALYETQLSSTDPLVADLGLFGVDGWGLRSSPADPFHRGLLERQPEPDLNWEPIIFQYGEVEQYPDRCGFRLVRRVYQAYGLREESMPREYDRETARLVLPE